MTQMIKLISRVMKLSGKYAPKIRVAFVCAAIKSILKNMPIFISFLAFSDYINGVLSVNSAIRSGIMLVTCVILEMICTYVSDYFQSGAGYMMFADKRLELGEHLKRLPMGYFTEGNLGKISSILSTDMAFVEEISMAQIADMMSYIFSAFMIIVMVFCINIKIGIVFVIFNLVIFVIAGKMNEMAIIEGMGRNEQLEKLTEVVLEFTEGISVIKSYNLLGNNSKKLSEAFKKSHDLALGFEESMMPWQLALKVVYGIGTVVTLIMGIDLVGKGEISVAYLLGLLLFVFELFGPVNALFGQATRLTVMSSALDRIEEIFEVPELNDNGKSSVPEKSMMVPEIEFENVSFAYDSKNVLENVSFKTMPNTMTALVGPSGGGKSTVASLLTRFWDVNGGSVKFRGVDIRDISLEDLMSHMSMVFQRVYLFEDTIYNNIAIGKTGATKEEVIAAAKKARCYDFIMDLPKGFDTVIEEGGASLSGGERQRISIARCILKDAPIVILDEATASVDMDNEVYIQEAINELVKGKTLLVIAHRLGTIKDADQILEVRDKNIVAIK